MPVDKYTKQLFREWQNQMKNKKYTKCMRSKNKKYENYYSIERLNKINNLIVSMIDFAVGEGYCSVNFAKQYGKIGSPKEITMCKSKTDYKTIDFDEYSRLMKVSEDNLKYNTYFDLELCRGHRTGEIRAFQVKCFDYENKRLKVEHTMSKDNYLKPPKTASSKDWIELDDSLSEKINNLINTLKCKPGFSDEWYIFGGKTTISSNALETAKNKYFKLAGINKHIRLHDFRHSCASWLFSIGIPVTVIAKILRHANANETLKTYTHLFNKDYMENLDKIDMFKRESFQLQDQKQDQNPIFGIYANKNP